MSGRAALGEERPQMTEAWRRSRVLVGMTAFLSLLVFFFNGERGSRTGDSVN
jgi:hypothetical protein